MPLAERVRAAVRDVPDFPRPGVLFRDITPLLADAALFRASTAALARAYADERIALVAGVESRGFILGAPIAQELGAGFVPVRKAGKLPRATLRCEYALEYGADHLEVHRDACPAASRVLLVDDVLATGGTAAAACTLIDQAGGVVVGCAFLLELTVLGGADRLAGRRCEVLVRY